MGILDRIRFLLETRKHKKYNVGKEFDKHGYRLVKCLNRGRFGTVHLAESKVTGQMVAIKVCEDSACMVGERHLWKLVNHPNCVLLHEQFNVKGYSHLVCDFAPNGDVMGCLERSGQPLGPHLEAFARRIARQVILAFEHCHEQGLSHLDFKWANVLLDGAFNVRLTGFGYMCSKADAQGICLGDPLYHPPEALTTGVSRETMDKVDMWQLGAALIHMLLGWYIPIIGVTPDTVNNNSNNSRVSDVALAVDIRNEIVHLPSRLSTCGLSKEAQHFLQWLLRYRPEDRPTATQALHHCWILGMSHMARDKVNPEFDKNRNTA